MLKLIYDERELKWFYDVVVAELKQNESHFLSLSARNKYLTDDEKVKYGLGRTEMFSRSLVRTNDWNKFLSTIRKYEVNEGAYLTKDGKNTIPSKCIVCYFNINPSDSIKAYREFSKVMGDYQFELMQCSVNKTSMDNILFRINKQQTLLMNCYQKATGIRHWLDFDFDVPKDFLLYIKKIVNEVKYHKGRAYIIDTKSGYHLLVSKDTEFDKFFNPKTIVDVAMQDVKDFLNGRKDLINKVEIIHNKNAMVPLPGTYQAGYEVRVINK